MPQENADQSDWIPEREERAPLHGRALGAASKCSGQREWNTGVFHAAEERRNKEANGTYVKKNLEKCTSCVISILHHYSSFFARDNNDKYLHI